MAELAVFGSILLMVLAFLVRYAMSYNNQQQFQMEAFRGALQKGFQGTDTMPAEIYKDYPMADPQDEYGAAARQVLHASEAPIEWSNESGWGGDGNSELNYTFTSGVDGATQEYRFTTSASMNRSLVGQSINVSYSFLPALRTIPYEMMRVFNNDTYPSGAVKIMAGNVANLAQCDSQYCPTDIIQSADVDSDGTVEPITGAYGPTGNHVTDISTIDPNEGELDLTNATQGIQQPVVTYARRDNMTIVDRGATVQSNAHLVDTSSSLYMFNLTTLPRQGWVFTSTEDRWINMTGTKR
jgi:hypothetical protein